MNNYVILLFILFSLSSMAQPAEINIYKLPAEASFRSIRIVNDSVIWLGGSNGTICKSKDGGINFSCFTVADHDSTEFRSMYAFNDKEVVIGNIGSPARILRTIDSGKSWEVVYENEHPDAFIDGIDFWNDREGICFGDPINNTMLLLRTSDGGKTWKQVHVSSRPLLTDGEFAFAASNTSMRCYPNGRVVIATGGALSRLIISDDYGVSWRHVLAPILQGESSTGIFSFDFYDENKSIIVGGDYQKETQQLKHVFYSLDGGYSWKEPEVPTRGYRECVTFISNNTAIATGPSGIDITYDGGNNWEKVSDEKGYHAIATADNKIYVSGKNNLMVIKLNR